MHKEPIGLYICRFLFSLGLFALMAMLYWSSTLLEENVRSLQEELSQIKNELLNIHLETNQIKENLSQAPPSSSPSSEKVSKSIALLKKSLIDPSLPNLLSTDLFYTKTLPQMLPKDFKTYGIRQESEVGRPDNLHPFSSWSHIGAWNRLCTDSVATEKFGQYETFAPAIALKMELRHNKEGQPEYWVHLRRDVFWQPLQKDNFAASLTLAPQFLSKHQVTAHDFKFYLDAVMNPHVDEEGAVALRTYYSDIRELEVLDDFTFIVRWKTEEKENAQGEKVAQMKYIAKGWTANLRPLPSFVYQYFADGTKIISDDSAPDTYRTNPIWAQNFSHHWAINVIVSCGPWIFNGMTDREIRFRRNPDYYEPYAVLVKALHIQFKDSPDAIWGSFKQGSLDTFQVSPNLLAEVERFLESSPYQAQKEAGLGIKRLDYVGRSYSYIGWNQANPLFQSKKVRQALTMAIDRKRIIENYLNGMGIEITGTFFKYSPSYDMSIVPYPFDLQQARTLLEEEGWYDSQGDGVLDKMIQGKRIPFKFTLTYYVKSPTTKTICEYIATTLKELGVICQLSGVDIADLSATFEDKSFDAISLGWSLGTPPEDPKQLWYSAGAKEKGSSNAIGFSNKEIDSIIDRLEFEYDAQERIKLYHQFDKILYEEAPYTFLYTPKITLIYRDYLQNVFIPALRQDLIPGANVAEPQSSIFWLKTH